MNEPVHGLSVRVYYEDTDFSGVVYHASYLRFLERARTETLRDLGIDQAALFGAGGTGAMAFVVRRMEIDWLKPAKMDDHILVETVIAEIGGASLGLEQKIMRGEEMLLTAKVTVVLVSGGKPARLPQEMRQKLGRS
jgi:acyl-CoA thioester hydrolase